MEAFSSWNAGQVKQKRCISNSVRLNFMVYQLHSACLNLFIINRCNLSGNIFAVRVQESSPDLPVPTLLPDILPVLSLLCTSASTSSFDKTLFICLQLICQFLIHSGCTSPLRFNDHDRSMCIIQEICSGSVLQNILSPPALSGIQMIGIASMWMNGFVSSYSQLSNICSPYISPLG